MTLGAEIEVEPSNYPENKVNRHLNFLGQSSILKGSLRVQLFLWPLRIMDQFVEANRLNKRLWASEISIGVSSVP